MHNIGTISRFVRVREREREREKYYTCDVTRLGFSLLGVARGCRIYTSVPQRKPARSEEKPLTRGGPVAALRLPRSAGRPVQAEAVGPRPPAEAPASGGKTLRASTSSHARAVSPCCSALTSVMGTDSVAELSKRLFVGMVQVGESSSTDADL